MGGGGIQSNAYFYCDDKGSPLGIVSFGPPMGAETSTVTLGYPPRVPSFVRYMQRPPLKYNLPLCSSPLGGSGSGGVNAEQRHQQQGRERQELQEEGMGAQ